MTRDSSQKRLNPNLYLVGFMGTGKTSVGKRLSERLKMTFLDVDQWIEAKEEKTVKEVFLEKGEAYFRSCEANFIKNHRPEGGYIVACGGGLITQEGLLEIMKNDGYLISLHASVESIVRRIIGDETRPLLKKKNLRKSITKLLEEREGVYSQVGLMVSTDGLTEDEVTKRVEKIYLKLLRKDSISETMS